MDATEIGCILAGTVAIGLLSARSHVGRRSRGRNMRYRGAPSACHAMRSNAQAGGAVAAKKSAASTWGSVSEDLSENIHSLFDSIDATANASQLATTATKVVKMQNITKMIQPLKEITTFKNGDAGGFKPRLGHNQWEQNPASMPSMTICGNVTLPFNALQEYAYEEQHGDYPVWGEHSSSKQGHPIDGALESTM